MNTRIAAVALVSAALVAGATTAASAAEPAPKPTITVSASTTHAKKGQPVAFTGRVTGLKNGTKVVLQEKSRGKWISLPVSTTVKRGTYRLTDKLKSTETLRIADGHTTSKPVTVTVR